MGKIKVLDKLTANMIAAGEVVERPASVVKEIFENSLDASSHRITVEIKDGGKELIRITDDGIGMDREDAKMCVLRHATSKISGPNDLFDIRTMGFSDSVIAALALLTHDENTEYMEYVTAIKKNPIATAVKLADLRHNSDLSRLDTADEKAEKRRGKYLAAIELLRG